MNEPASKPRADDRQPGRGLGARLARPGVVPVYPITPQTPVLEQITASKRKVNLTARSSRPSPEHSVMSACIRPRWWARGFHRHGFARFFVDAMSCCTMPAVRGRRL